MCAAKDSPRPAVDREAVDRRAGEPTDDAGGAVERGAPAAAALPSVPAPPPGGWPAWFDPSRDLMLTPRRLRGLVHPIRVRLLFLLETDGPATASQLGRRIGHSSGVTSYHLRFLAELGFVAEATELGNGRDRWWRSTYRSSGLTFRSPDDPVDPESVEVAEQYMRLVVDSYHERMLKYIDTLTTRIDELPTLPWSLNEYALEVTHDEARELTAKVSALLQPYRRPRPDEPGQPSPAARSPRDGAVRAIFQFQVLPDDPVLSDDPAPTEEAS
jgi:hypothetical protein